MVFLFGSPSASPVPVNGERLRKVYDFGKEHGLNWLHPQEGHWGGGGMFLLGFA